MRININIKFSLFLILSLLFASTLCGQTVKRKNLQDEREQLRREIEKTNKQLLDTGKQSSLIAKKLNLINKQIDDRKRMIELLVQEAVAIEAEQKAIEEDIVSLEKKIEVKQQEYAKAITGVMNRRMTENKLFFILSSKSLGESLRRVHYLKDYSSLLKSQAEDVKEQKRKLNEKREVLEKNKKEKLSLLSFRKDEERKLQIEEQKRKTEMVASKDKEKKLRSELLKKKKRAEKLNSEIDRLMAQEMEAQRKAEENKRKEREKAQKKKPVKVKPGDEKSDPKADDKKKPSGSTASSSDDRTGLASAETLNLSKKFANNKGRLPMPVNAKWQIVTGFGVIRDSEWRDISRQSNGIDIKTTKNANACAVFEGVVTIVSRIESAQLCVTVRHGEYVTLYTNLEKAFVKRGDRIKTGQAIGKIHADKDTGETVMHFQIWKDRTRLNPTVWLKR